MDFTISCGFSNAERSHVAALYWEAFSAKLTHVMGPDAKALAFLATHLNPDFALVARDQQGEILGVAGFKTTKGALVGGEFRDLTKTYGWLSALWRAPFLALMERDLADDTLLMDGICVSAGARGMGVGSALLNAIKQHARDSGLSSVRLDVIDTNPRAKALYLRKGFEVIGTENIGPLRWIFGFRISTKMLCRI